MSRVKVSLLTSDYDAPSEYHRLCDQVPQVLRRKEAAHPGGVTDLAFSGDGSLLASCGRDGRLLVHSLDTNEAGDQTSLLFEDHLFR